MPFFFFPRVTVRDCIGLLTVIAMRQASGKKQPGRLRRRRWWWLEPRISNARFSDCAQCDPRKKSRENGKKRAHGTSPRSLRGFTLMAPRHIYNPTTLRRRGRFPVQLSSCANALQCCLIPQCSQGYEIQRQKKNINREKLREPVVQNHDTYGGILPTMKVITSH